VQCHPHIELKKQVCGYCGESKFQHEIAITADTSTSSTRNSISEFREKLNFFQDKIGANVRFSYGRNFKII